MTDDELGPLLGSQEGIVPSSGFVACVMDAVRKEAATPPPIPFPWKRAVPGVTAGLLTLIYALVALARVDWRTVPANRLLGMMTPVIQAQVEWLTIALVLTFAAVALSLRFASRVKYHVHTSTGL